MSKTPKYDDQIVREQLNILYKETFMLCEEKTWYAKWIQIKCKFIKIN